MSSSQMIEFKTKEELRSNFYQIVFPKMVWKTNLTSIDLEVKEMFIKEFNINLDVLRFYSNKQVLYEIVKTLGNNELCLDNDIRWCFASKIEYLFKIFYFYRFFEKPKTMYKGLSRFKYRLAPPFGMKAKKKWQEEIWTGGQNLFMSSIIGYDFGIDLDAETFEEAYKDAKKLFNYFKSFNIKFSIWCSGKKGFHFIIPFEEFKDLINPFSVDNVTTFCKSLALDLKDKLKLHKIDEIIYTATRFLKCSYTLDARNNRVIFPLRDEEFKKFNELYFNIDYCLNQPDLGYRGQYPGKESNLEGIKKMLGDL